ncbi:MAG: copper homeostasis protein CutC [Flavobacteriales bacterium]
MNCNRIIILAAGRSSRMKRSAESMQSVLSDEALNRPKPMLRVGPNREPMLQFILEQSLRAGFTEATIVIGPEDELTPAFVADWNQKGPGIRMRMRCVIQGQPLGTGHAVKMALEQDPVSDDKAWILCNGDNLPTREALARLRSAPDGQALLAYDRYALGLDPKKTMAFAVIEGDDHWVNQIVEKPTESFVKELEKKGTVRVSMNIFRLNGSKLMPYLNSLQPHPDRGELELPTALQAMMEDGHAIEKLDIAAPVLDLTQLQDVASVQEGLNIMEPFQLEVCASSPEDVEVAMKAGAHRVELCAHWECGGLTSPETDLRLSVKSGIPVHALIRCRAGHFSYSDAEKSWMTEQIRSALQAGAARVVVGALDDRGDLDMELLGHWVKSFGAHRLVIHRSIDASSNWEKTVSDLMELGVLRLLTSGGEMHAIDGIDRIEKLVKLGFEVTVGSGVMPNQMAQWQAVGVEHFHASCRSSEKVELPIFDGTVNRVSSERVRSWFNR